MPHRALLSLRKIKKKFEIKNYMKSTHSLSLEAHKRGEDLMFQDRSN